MKEPLVKLPGAGTHAHHLVAKTAREMAEEVYEHHASNNEFYARYPDQADYVNKCWPLFLESARATLAQMLATNIDEALKQSIHDALIRDATLRRGREGVLQMKPGAGK